MASPSIFNKAKLSGSGAGNRGIKVAKTATAGTTLHTAVAGTTANTFDEVWIWAYNSHTAPVVLTIEQGGVTDPDDLVVVTIPNKAGWVPVIAGVPYQNGVVIGAFSATNNVITISGYVNEIRP